MLLEHQIFARYELYKAGTSRFTSWVVATAASVGYGDPNSRDANITVAKLKQCADAVAKSSVDIPSNITELLEDVIIGRQIFADWYAVQADSDLEKNQSHQHFIDVLREILRTLKEKRCLQRTQAREVPRNAPLQTAEPLNEQEAVANIYEMLKVEEVATDPLGYSTSARQAQKQSRSRPQQRTLKTESDDKFMIFCILKDLQDLRNVVQEAWKEYASGELSNFVAASVTQAAFKSMVYLVSDYEKKVAGKLDPMDIARSLKLTLEQKELDDGKLRTRFVNCGTSETSNVSDMLCPVALVALTKLLREYDGFRTNRKKGAHNYSPNAEAMEFAEKTHPFLKTLLGWFPETWAEEPENRDTSMDSEDCVFVQSLWRMQRHSKVTLADVSICQSYMDIYDEFGGDFEFGAREYSDAIERLKFTTSSFADFLSKYGSGSPSSHQTQISSLVSEFKVVETRAYDRFGSQETPVPREVVLLRAFPMQLALRVRNLILQTQIVSFGIANIDVVVQFFAYMYRAAVWLGMTPEWPDMERLIANQARSHAPALVQDVPRHGNFVQFHTHLSLYMMGKSAQGKTTRASALEKFRKRAPKLSSGIEYIATQAAIKVKHSDHEGNPSSRVDYEQLAIDEMASKAGGNSVIKRLEIFKSAMIRDEAELYFDHSAIWKECKTMLDKIWNLCLKNPGKLIKMEDLHLQIEIVRAILIEVMSYQTIDGAFKLHTDLKVTKLGLVASMLEKMIKTSGDRVSKEADETCQRSRTRFRSRGLEQEEEKAVDELANLSLESTAGDQDEPDCSRPATSNT